MRVKIYQINPERDNNRMKFMSLSDSQSPDPSIYDEVFDAEIDENELEEKLSYAIQECNSFGFA